LQGFLKVAKEIALLHHENYDGTGYPNGFKKDEIPLSARICALADSYDALSSDRPYREALSHKKICDIILKKQSYKYDPEILKVFSEHNKVFKEIREVYKKSAKFNPCNLKKQCAWCKSLFIFDKWLPYNETILEASHGVCPECMKILKSESGINT
jgi:HD-GYP domain-containing protein (c-di-GMP phosphodiesterase class II)